VRGIAKNAKIAKKSPGLQHGKTRMRIYIALLNEGVPCWRPVEAEKFSSGSFRILSTKPDDEQWQFQPGDVVYCQEQQFQGGRGLVACKKASPT
jgi:hypothetical protein